MESLCSTTPLPTILRFLFFRFFVFFKSLPVLLTKWSEQEIIFQLDLEQDRIFPTYHKCVKPMIFQYEFQFWEHDVNGLFAQNLHWCWKRNYKHASDHTRDLRDVMHHLRARTLGALPLIDRCLVSDCDMETNPRNHGRLEEKCVYPDQLLSGCWLTLGEIASSVTPTINTFTFLASIPIVLLVIALVVSRLLQLAVICMEDASMTLDE